MILFQFAMRLIAPFHQKAKLMVKGQKETFNILKSKIAAGEKYVWFHCASLGEFEQARPLIETLKKDDPQYKILLSFFSPSGYEVRKDYPLADVVCYLPFDTKRNVRRFLDLAKPTYALFIKYEFWYNFIHETYLRHIPLYLVSAIFRPEQPFFRKRAGRYGKMLRFYTHIFVQDENSEKLLATLGLSNVTVAGDTRLDRVIEIQHQAKQLPVVEKFIENAGIVLVAGSSWPPDEEIFTAYFNAHPELKLIIAPHEIDEAHLSEIEAKLKRPHIRYSQSSAENAQEADCLIVDSFGLLSSIYRYGNIAYIGGGFGVGIHNLPEAAVYAIPVIFGPNYHKFREAHELIKTGGGFTIRSKQDFWEIMNRFSNTPSALSEAGKRAAFFIENNAGATKKIFEEIQF